MAAVSLTPGPKELGAVSLSGIVLPDINACQHHALCHTPFIYLGQSSPTPCLLPTYSFAAFYGSNLFFSCNDEPVITLSPIPSRPNQTNGFYGHDARGRGCRGISAMDGTTCSEKPRPLTVISRGPLAVAVCLVPARTAAGTYMQLSLQFDSSRLHFNLLVSSSFRSGGACSMLSALSLSTLAVYGLLFDARRVRDMAFCAFASSETCRLARVWIDLPSSVGAAVKFLESRRSCRHFPLHNSMFAFSICVSFSIFCVLCA